MEDQEGDHIKIRQQCNAFSNRLFQLSAQSELYAVFGGHKSGKSITVDLLAGKKLKLFDDPQLATTVIVSQQNQKQQYPQIYIVNNHEAVVMQSFTLDEDLNDNFFQVVKLIYLEQYLQTVGKVIFVVVCDQAMIQNTLQLIEHFLHCMGITSESIDERIHLLKEYVFLFITKIEPQASQDYMQILKELKQIAINENIAQIMSHIIQGQKIAEFKVQPPAHNFANKIRQEFALRNNRKQLIQMFQNSSLRKQRQKGQLILQSCQKQVIDLFQNLANMIINLVLFSSNKEINFRKEYETIAKSIFPTHKRKNQIQNMIGKWNIQLLKDFKLDISEKNINKQSLTILSAAFIQIIRSILPHSPDAKQDLLQIMYMMIFCSRFKDWFQQKLLQSNIYKIVNSFEKVSKQLKLRSSKKEPLISNSKKKNTLYSAFKQLIQSTCHSNKDAISSCIDVIKLTEETANYDYYDVIYYIKLLRDLLEHLNQAGIEDQCHFIDQLIEIALYSENGYNLDLYIRLGIQNSLFNQKSVLNLIKILLEYRKLDQCQKIIKYAQDIVINSESFHHLTLIMIMVLQQKNKNHQAVQDVNLSVTFPLKKLSFSIQTIQSKSIQSEKLQKMLQQLTFRKYLITSNV